MLQNPPFVQARQHEKCVGQNVGQKEVIDAISESSQREEEQKSPNEVKDGFLNSGFLTKLPEIVKLVHSVDCILTNIVKFSLLH